MNPGLLLAVFLVGLLVGVGFGVWFTKKMHQLGMEDQDDVDAMVGGLLNDIE